MEQRRQRRVQRRLDEVPAVRQLHHSRRDLLLLRRRLLHLIVVRKRRAGQHVRHHQRHEARLTLVALHQTLERRRTRQEQLREVPPQAVLQNQAEAAGLHAARPPRLAGLLPEDVAVLTAQPGGREQRRLGALASHQLQQALEHRVGRVHRVKGNGQRVQRVGGEHHELRVAGRDAEKEGVHTRARQCLVPVLLRVVLALRQREEQVRRLQRVAGAGLHPAVLQSGAH